MPLAGKSGDTSQWTLIELDKDDERRRITGLGLDLPKWRPPRPHLRTACLPAIPSADLCRADGQDARVQTLSNAIARGRIAHAFLLTECAAWQDLDRAADRQALNCVDPTAMRPDDYACNVCEPCQAIAAGRHIDVLEMTPRATRIDDVREIIDSVRYATTSARFKIYITMKCTCSRTGVHGLLKTLKSRPSM